MRHRAIGRPEILRAVAFGLFLGGSLMNGIGKTWYGGRAYEPAVILGGALFFFVWAVYERVAEWP